MRKSAAFLVVALFLGSFLVLPGGMVENALGAPTSVWNLTFESSTEGWNYGGQSSSQAHGGSWSLIINGYAMGSWKSLTSVPTGNYTVQTWIYPNAAEPCNIIRLVNSNSNDLAYTDGMDVYYDVYREIRCYDGSTTTYTGHYVTLNTWQNIRVEVSADHQTYNVYLDGEQIATNINTKTGSAGSGSYMHIGYIGGATPNCYFDDYKISYGGNAVYPDDTTLYSYYIYDDQGNAYSASNQTDVTLDFNAESITTLHIAGSVDSSDYTDPSAVEFKVYAFKDYYDGTPTLIMPDYMVLLEGSGWWNDETWTVGGTVTFNVTDPIINMYGVDFDGENEYTIFVYMYLNGVKVDTDWFNMTLTYPSVEDGTYFVQTTFYESGTGNNQWDVLTIFDDNTTTYEFNWGDRIGRLQFSFRTTVNTPTNFTIYATIYDEDWNVVCNVVATTNYFSHIDWYYRGLAYFNLPNAIQINDMDYYMNATLSYENDTGTHTMDSYTIYFGGAEYPPDRIDVAPMVLVNWGFGLSGLAILIFSVVAGMWRYRNGDSSIGAFVYAMVAALIGGIFVYIFLLGGT